MKMNRRLFLKSVSAAVAVISVPVIPAIAKPKPKWNRFSEATPKVGQKIMIVSEITTLGMICGGVVKELPNRKCVSSQYLALRTDDDFYVGYNGGYPIGISYSEEGKEILSTRDWIREREFIAPRDYSERNVPPHDGDYHKETYLWLPVVGDYPKTIPPIPTNPTYAYLENIRS
jgi:hypothetical protein